MKATPLDESTHLMSNEPIPLDEAAVLSMQVAERIMDYAICEPVTHFGQKFPDLPCYWPSSYCPERTYRGANGDRISGVWHPALNLNDCRDAELKIEELGYRDEYVAALLNDLGVVFDNHQYDFPHGKNRDCIWEIMVASPKHRCRAMLAAHKWVMDATPGL